MKQLAISLFLCCSLASPSLAVDLKPAIDPPTPAKHVNPILHPIQYMDTVPLTHPRAWRVFRTRVKPSAEFGMSVVTCIFSIAGAFRR